ncbi:MAG: hypothetical protein KGR46_07440 [Verrucomicrobia bacterium]|nr:hypothetical protein [Verrucomicrobiota bacterium]
MSYTIFSKSAAFPVAIGGSKIVKTFPSGLVLVSQEYAVPRGQEDTYAAAFAVGQPLAVDSPAIDGLYIFPEPEWRDSGDGFTRLTVSAYGRSKMPSANSFERNSFKNSYLYMQSFFQGPTSSLLTTISSSFPAISDTFTQRGVFLSSTPPPLQKPTSAAPLVLPGPAFNTPLVAGTVVTGSTFQHAGQTWEPIKTTHLDIYLNGYTVTNFGTFSEFVVVWESFAQVGDGYRVV